MSSDYPHIEFYTLEGELIHEEEMGEHDLTAGLVSFSGANPRPAREMSLAELKTVQAWLMFLAADNNRMAEVTSQLLDMFKGYPAGTTMGEIMSGKAQKILSPVETPGEHRGE